LGIQQIRDDMMYLAGQLAHRSAQTQDERAAADFIARRMREYADEVTQERFFAIENYPYLFASYYSEFLVVGILSIWWPLVAFLYGIVVFITYLAEFMGFQVFSRFFPKFESQNVCAHFSAPKTDKVILVTAHYDSGCASPLTLPHVVPWLRFLHLMVLGAMVILSATCLVEGLYPASATAWLIQLRWLCVLFLGSCSLGLFYAAARGEDIRGANSNASGVSALLQLAACFQREPLQNSTVQLIATGSHEVWMSGIRHYLANHPPDKKKTYILNLESVGAGRLHYLQGEGMLHYTSGNKTLINIAERLSPEFGATAARLRALPTEAHVPLLHGYKVMTLMGLDDQGLPPNWNQVTDRVAEVDETAIEHAANFAEKLLRTLDKE